MKNMKLAAFLKSEKRSAFYEGCALPLGYVPGLPVIGAVAGKLCLKVPYLKYKITGEVDKTLVFPARYVLTYSLPDMRPVGFEDLAYNRAFRKVDFGKPVGFFRHDAIKSLTKKEYKEKRDALMSMYDEVIEAILAKKPYARGGEFKKLLGMMIEPSQKPIYKAIDKKFYDNFLA